MSESTKVTFLCHSNVTVFNTVCNGAPSCRSIHLLILYMWCPLACYTLIKRTLASCHLLLYLVYMPKIIQNNYTIQEPMNSQLNLEQNTKNEEIKKILKTKLSCAEEMVRVISVKVVREGRSESEAGRISKTCRYYATRKRVRELWRMSGESTEEITELYRCFQLLQAKMNGGTIQVGKCCTSSFYRY